MKQISMPGLHGEVCLQNGVQLLGYSTLSSNNLVDLRYECAKEGGCAEEEENAVHLQAKVISEMYDKQW